MSKHEHNWIMFTNAKGKDIPISDNFVHSVQEVVFICHCGDSKLVQYGVDSLISKRIYMPDQTKLSNNQTKVKADE